MVPAAGPLEIEAIPLLTTLLLAFALSALVLAVAMLFDSPRDTPLVRAGQRLRLVGMRMPRMLQRHGIAVGDYLDSLSVAQIREHIRNCDRCSLGDLCDRDLDARHPCTRTSFAYCPNRNAVQRYLVRKRSA